MRTHQVWFPLAVLACVTALAAVLAAMPLLAGQDPAAPATIAVAVPADATITIDGHLTKETGADRLFVTPPLQPGKTFHYEIAARWMANGLPVERVRTVEVSSGATIRVDFLREEGQTKTPNAAAEQVGDFAGKVQIAGSPVAGSTVTLYAASAGKPVQLAQAKTADNGTFKLDAGKLKGSADKVLYLVAKGGTPKASTGKGANDAIALMALLGPKVPAKVTINELTTVASAFTAAHFINGESISGNSLGLRIAAMNVPNLANLQSGGWGSVIVDGLNLTRSTTLSNFNTLASLVTYASTSASSDWRSRFFKAATPGGGTAPSNTLGAMAGIARQSWAHPKDLFALFEEAYPQAKEGLPDAAPFAPYLIYAPNDFALVLRFSGGGLYAPGRLMFDGDSNLWSGVNWMPGSQSNAAKNIGGGVAKFGPDGSVLSPPVTGFMGAGINGVGWGTAVTKENVWISSFNGKILVMDLQGRPVAREQDFPFKEKLSGLMGIGVAANGDVWIADGEGGQLLFFPGGRVKDGRIVKVAGLAGPFDVVVDDQDRVWVSNSRSDTVVRFPANDPKKVETFKVGLAPARWPLIRRATSGPSACYRLTFRV